MRGFEARAGRLGTLAIALMLCLAAFTLAACGSDDDGGGDAAAPTSTSGGGGSDIVAEAQANVEAARRGTDVDKPLPSSAPKPAAGKNVWVISCGQAAEGCARGARGAVEAAKLLGWKATLFDGRLDVSTFAKGIRQAIADGADGIVLDAIDCPVVQQPLQEARRAGVQVVGIQSIDCDDRLAGGGEPLFANSTIYSSEHPKQADSWRAHGALMADAIIAATDGKADAIEFADAQLLAPKAIAEGFEARMAQCEDCKVTKVSFTIADLGPALTSKADSALLRDPNVNAVMGNYDTAMVFIAPAIQRAGLAARVFSVGLEGHRSSIDLIRTGRGQNADTGNPDEWVGWATIDDLVRLFAGERPVAQEIGLQYIDRDDLPPTGQYEGNRDWKANFQRIWGLRG
jgi:ribose transport system substrate-binding protein